jgi:hypothetical protein
MGDDENLYDIEQTYIPANNTYVNDQSGALVYDDTYIGTTAPYDHTARLSDKIGDFFGMALDNVTFNQRLQNAQNNITLKRAQSPTVFNMLTPTTLIALAVVAVLAFVALVFGRR